jgi:hypothetical protein
VWPARDEAGRQVARRGVHAWLQVRSREDIETALGQVRAWADAPPGDDPRPLTIDELRELAQHVTIGAHGRDHLSLRWLPQEAQREQMSRSRDDLQRWLGTVPTAFSYPFGVPGRDVDDITIAVARELGYAAAVVNDERPISAGIDALALPRPVAANVPGPSLLTAVVGENSRK